LVFSTFAGFGASFLTSAFAGLAGLAGVTGAGFSAAAFD
jgi:hypothetical protein